MHRRHFLQTLVLSGCTRFERDEEDDANASFVRIPFADEDVTAFDTPVGVGLDGRLYRDLSDLTATTLVTPNDRFYIRTRTPDRIDYTRPWTVRVVDRDRSADEIAALARPLGVTLLECSGNARGGGFGLMSAAEWSGVPLTELLPAGDERVLVNGFDDHSQPSVGGHSVPGASWIFSRADLEATGAFLATTMNGAPLPADHGFPIRLVVPGWYGCTCIKWVDRISLVSEDEPATAHMKEFASRTQQAGVPELARDFAPAAIDVTAMPVRIEVDRVRGLVRIVGVTWGGDASAKELVLSWNEPNGPSDRVRIDRSDTNARTWALWELTRPLLPSGRYRLTLRVADPVVRTRRLDNAYYARVFDL